MEPVRWGVLGTAKIAVEKVIPGFRRTDSAEVVAIASRDAARAQACAARLGIPKAYGGYEALLADAMEAVIAALYLDAGLETTRSIVLSLWGDRIDRVDADARDAKTQLQEWAQARGLSPPRYIEKGRADGLKVVAQGGIAVLRGNLAPKGAVLKPSAASPHLLVHRGRAVVFEDIDDYKARINDDALEIDETCVMVMKYCGPKGYPGMAEVGNMGLPPKVLKKGITDMVRISDARMSGTA